MRPRALQGPSPSLLKIAYKRVLRRLSSLPLAIAEMGVIAALSAVGTVIEQNKPIQFYIDNYPDGQQKARHPPAASQLSQWPSSVVSTGLGCSACFESSFGQSGMQPRQTHSHEPSYVRQGVWHSSGVILQRMVQPSTHATSTFRASLEMLGMLRIESCHTSAHH